MSEYKGTEKGKIYVVVDKEENKFRIFRLNEVYSVNHKTNEVRVRSNSVITFDYNNRVVEYSNNVFQNFIINKGTLVSYKKAASHEIALLKAYNYGNCTTNMHPFFPECGLKFLNKDEEIITIKDKKFKLYLSQKEIEERIKALAESINKNKKYNKDNIPVILIVLKGSFLFATELIKNFDFDCEIHFIKASSYRGIDQGDLIMTDNFEGIYLKDRDVFVLEDIVDTGNTLNVILKALQYTYSKNIKVLSLLDKPAAHKNSFTNITSCFKIPNDFVVGYGLDYDQLGRNLKNIYTLVK